METVPTVMQIAIAGSIIAGSAILGIVANRFIVRWVKKMMKKRSIKGEDVLIKAFRSIVVVLFLLVGLHFVVLNLPLSRGIIVVVNVVVKVTGILVVTIFISRVVVGAIEYYTRRNQGLVQTTSILENISRIIIYLVGILIALQSVGVSITPVLTVLGVGGLAISLALKDTLSNLFAGVHIIVSKNMNPGDYVKLETGDEGYITDVNWRSTTIRTLTNQLIIIPNEKLAASVVNNYSLPDKEVALVTNIGVGYHSDLRLVERVTLEEARAVMGEVPGCIQGFEPLVRFHTFGSYSIQFNVVLRVSEFVDSFLVRHELMKRLVARYQQEGIEMPSSLIAFEALGRNAK